MTDRELLEAAAKAAGMTLSWGGVFRIGEDEVDCSDMAYAVSDDREELPAYWNPLADDGDALRLAVKLHFLSEYVPEFESGMTDAHGAADPYAATRRAIVRAAAAIRTG